MGLVVNKGGSKMAVHDPEDKDYPPMRRPDGQGKRRQCVPCLVGHNVAMNYFAFSYRAPWIVK